MIMKIFFIISLLLHITILLLISSRASQINRPFNSFINIKIVNIENQGSYLTAGKINKIKKSCASVMVKNKIAEPVPTAEKELKLTEKKVEMDEKKIYGQTNLILEDSQPVIQKNNVNENGGFSENGIIDGSTSNNSGAVDITHISQSSGMKNSDNKLGFGLEDNYYGSANASFNYGNSYKSYISYIALKIEKRKYYPAKAKNIEGKVKVTFTVRKDGELANVKITESSGSEILDNAAVSTLRKAAPFKKFPDDLKQKEIVFNIPFIYKVGD